MTRWNWKRWAFALVTGTTLTSSFATLASDDMPKSGETIKLKFPGQADRVVTVLKSTRKPDGSLETEVKDSKSGDRFTLVDPAPGRKVPASAKPVATSPPVAAAPAFSPPPKPVVVNTPTIPAAPQALPALATPKPVPVASATPMPPMAEPRPTRAIGGGKIFSREPEGPITIPHTPAAAAATPVLPRKTSVPKASTPSTLAQPPASVSAPAASPISLPKIHTNQEPPRAQPVKPAASSVASGTTPRVIPPTPVVPQVSVPSSPAAAPVSLANRAVPPLKPLPPVVAPSLPVQRSIAVPNLPAPPLPPAKPTLPSTAVPNLPAPPLPPAKPTLPSTAVPNLPAPTPPPVAVPAIPATPISKVPVVPTTVVKPASKPEVVRPLVHSLPAEVEPHAKTLKDALAPSVRLKAAKELATGPHANSASVQALLFQTAKSDPCPAVKADCIEYLAKLGYRDPAFVGFVKAACTDESGEVRVVAKDAMMKLAPR